MNGGVGLVRNVGKASMQEVKIVQSWSLGKLRQANPTKFNSPLITLLSKVKFQPKFPVPFSLVHLLTYSQNCDTKNDRNLFK